MNLTRSKHFASIKSNPINVYLLFLPTFYTNFDETQNIDTDVQDWKIQIQLTNIKDTFQKKFKSRAYLKYCIVETNLKLGYYRIQYEYI